MRLSLVFVCAAILCAATPFHEAKAQGQQSTPTTPTIKVTSALVFLDVTVLDKKGHPVVSGLTKDDFTITEDKIPQTIFSFEAPQAHVNAPASADANPTGEAPLTILVLDQLNSDFSDFAYIRYETEQFLKSQPRRLTSPTELLLVGNDSMQMLQGLTTNRADLLDALHRLPPSLPYKHMNRISFGWELFGQSLDALVQIALQNKGVPGRKNVVWVGHGSPNVYLGSPLLSPQAVSELKQYAHSTTNMLVDARISLFVIYPGLPVRGNVTTFSAMQAIIDIGDDPFAGDINFGLFANETGGKLFYNNNNVDDEMKQSEQMGANYYTLTYQPQNLTPDGKFRRVRVTLRNSDLRAVTKAGFYAPDAHAPIDPRQERMIKLTDAVQSTLPFDALGVSLSDLVYQTDTRTVEFTVELKSRNLVFQPSDNGTSAAILTVAAASLDQYGKILASRTDTDTLVAHSPNPTQLPDILSHFRLTLHVPRKTTRVRVVIQAEDGGRIGSAELDRKTLDSATATATPRPVLERRPPTPASTSP
jgi:VWFA-related protein